MARPNIYESTLEFDPSDPDPFRAAQAKIGELAGGKEIILRLFEVPPGQSLCPYHYEYVEEWIIVLSGEIELRSPSGTETLKAGDVVCCPPGPDGAHKTTNRGSEAVRMIMFSTNPTTSIAVYPDSGKVGVWSDNEADSFMFRREDGPVEYYDGEL
jgi:uncharacterized cupin superfamily protein